MKVFKGGADRRLKLDQDKLKKHADDKNRLMQYRGSTAETILVDSDCGPVRSS